MAEVVYDPPRRHECSGFPDPWETAWDTVVACSCQRRWVRRYCDGGFGGEACWVRLRWWHLAAHRGLWRGRR